MTDSEFRKFELRNVKQEYFILGWMVGVVSAVIVMKYFG